MRFFIALEIPDISKNQIRKVQQRLKELIPQVRIADTSKLHLTIAFISDQPESIKTRLVSIIQEAVTGLSAFEVTPAFLDGFPNLHHPHTLWIGVKGDIDMLHLIRERIKDELVSLNLPADERRYTPHIAVAKVKGYKLTKGVEKQLQQLMLQPFDPIIISEIKLFESIPDEGFHTHNTLAKIELSKA